MPRKSPIKAVNNCNHESFVLLQTRNGFPNCNVKGEQMIRCLDPKCIAFGRLVNDKPVWPVKEVIEPKSKRKAKQTPLFD